MADRKLVVTIVGDDRSLQAALTRSTAATARFGQTASRNLSGISSLGSFGPMLEDVRRMRAEAEALAGGLRDTDTAARGATRGVGAFVARAGLAGAAITTMYQASRAASEALKQTGAAAFTTEGRIRNLGSALLSGDIVGGIKALGATPKTFEDLGISVTEAKNRLEEFQAVADAGLGDLSGAAREAIQIVAQLNAAEASAAALADATARIGTSFRTATGDVVAFKGAVDDAAGLRGTGGVAAINEALELAASGAGGARAPRPIGPTARNANAQIVAAANEDLAEVLRLQVIERDRLAKAVENSRGNRDQRIALARDAAIASAAVISTEKQIASNAEAAARAREQAAEAARREAEAAERERRARAKAAAERAAALKEQQLALEQARQFRAIGLSSSGDQPIPTIENLQKQLAQLDRRLISEDVPSKLTNRLAGVRKVLVDGIRKATPETRSAIQDLFNTIRKAFADEQAKGPLTKTTSLNASKVLEGLGLGRDLEKELRARLSSFNSAGVALTGTQAPRTGDFRGGPVVVEANITTVLDGEVLGKSTKRFTQKDKRRNPRQKRGPNTGI